MTLTMTTVALVLVFVVAFDIGLLVGDSLGDL